MVQRASDNRPLSRLCVRARASVRTSIYCLNIIFKMNAHKILLKICMYLSMIRGDHFDSDYIRRKAVAVETLSTLSLLVAMD